MTARPASQAPFPYRSNHVCWIEMTDEGPKQLHLIEDKRAAVVRARKSRARKPRLFAVWPGEWRSDLFVLDDLDVAAESLGVKQ